MPLSEAMQLAEQSGVDLIQMPGKVNPPVCRLGEIKKFAFEQSRNETRAKDTKVKEIRFGTKIAEHDFNTKAQMTKKFLEKGLKCIAVLIWTAQETPSEQAGKAMATKLLEKVKDVGRQEGEPTLKGRNYAVNISPLKARVMAPKKERKPRPTPLPTDVELPPKPKHKREVIEEEDDDDDFGDDDLD